MGSITALRRVDLDEFEKIVIDKEHRAIERRRLFVCRREVRQAIKRAIEKLRQTSGGASVSETSPLEALDAELEKLNDAPSSLTVEMTVNKVNECLINLKNLPSDNLEIKNILMDTRSDFEHCLGKMDRIRNSATCGLALSGGGVRSATFNLGVLQALHYEGFLPKIDYLSTVSGGGYIGSALTYFMNQNYDKFPFTHENEHVKSIRRNASYLTPGRGLNNWALIAALLRGIIINAALIIPPVLGGMWLLKWSCDCGAKESFCLQPNWMTGKGVAIGAVLGGFLSIELYRAFMKRWSTDAGNCWWRQVPWWLLAFIFIGLVLIGYKFQGLDDSHVINFVRIPILFVFGYGALFMVCRAFRRPNSNGHAEESHSMFSSKPSKWLQKFWYFLFELLSWSAVFGVVYGLWSVVSKPNWVPYVDPPYPAYMVYLALLGCTLLSRLLIANVFYAALSQTPRRLRLYTHYHFSVQYGDYLSLGVLFLLIGIIPFLHAAVLNYVELILPSVSLLGVVSTAIGWITRGRASELRGYVAFFLRTGLILLLISALLWAYHAVAHAPPAGSVWPWWAAVLWIAAVIIIDINYVSMHRYYRNRLIEAFFQPSPSGKQQESGHLPLREIDIGCTGGPYHIVNANLVTVGSRDEKYGARLGDNFIFSPLFIGSKSTGWVPSNCHRYRHMNLGTAMAISGAAVDPNTGATNSWSLRIVMGLLNVRLGYWLESPTQQKDDAERRKWGSRFWHEILRLGRESWVNLAAREILGFPNEKWNYVIIYR